MSNYDGEPFRDSAHRLPRVTRRQVLDTRTGRAFEIAASIRWREELAARDRVLSPRRKAARTKAG